MMKWREESGRQVENTILRDIAKRVIEEREIESVVHVDEFEMENCSKFINKNFPNDECKEWLYSLIANAVSRYHPIQRVKDDARSRHINEIFALTCVLEVLNFDLMDENIYPREKSGAIARQILKYFIDGSNDPHAILCMIRYMNHIV